MLLNADLSERVVMDSHALAWQPSPSPLVQRRLLERDGAEVARATSIVRYAPGASFAAHWHDLGEEIVVLDGTLSDDAGHYGPGSYPQGSWIRSPHLSQHQPFSVDGCLILVKTGHLAAC